MCEACFSQDPALGPFFFSNNDDPTKRSLQVLLSEPRRKALECRCCDWPSLLESHHPFLTPPSVLVRSSVGLSY